MTYHYSVFIGRFQPFHSGHLYVVNEALTVSEKLILLVGSANRARSIRNPFTFLERKKMLLADLQSTGIDISRIYVAPINDYYYDEQAWIDEVTNGVNQHVKSDSSVVLVGHNKDSSSYYLSLFPHWHYREVDNFRQFNATEFRKDYFSEGKLNKGYLVKGEGGYALEGVYSFLLLFEKEEAYLQLKEEYAYVETYQNSWKNTPYPVIHTTVDAMVICQGHLLVIRRKGLPGAGLFALPGGFLEISERVTAGVLRELQEETALALSMNDMRMIQLFDHPERSVLGRIITHVGLFELERDTLPLIDANDDAKEALWLEINQVHQMACLFFDDHYQIIRSLLKQV